MEALHPQTHFATIATSLLRHIEARREIYQLRIHDLVVHDHEADTTRQTEPFEELGLVLTARHRNHVGVVQPAVVERMEVARNLNVGSQIPIHRLRPLLLFVADRVRRIASGMKQVDRDLLRQDKSVTVLSNIHDVVSSLMFSPLMVKATSDE